VASEIELANDPRLQELLMLQVRKYDQYIVPAKADPNQQPAKGDVGIGLGHRLWEEWAVAKAHEGIAWKDYVAKFRVISADHPCYIVEVVAGSPSAIAGVPEHAILSHIDGHPIDGKLLKDATEMLVGPPGSTVELTVQGLDKDGKRLEENKYKVVRNGYHKPAVRFKDLGNGVAYLRIDSFIEAPDGGPSVVAEFKIALQELVKKGFTKVVFDVRDNPGGRVDFCLDMLEWVLPTGYAVTQLERKDDYLLRSTVSFTRDLRLVTKPSKDRKSFEFDCTQRELILPETTAVVVLTNGNTASCGELFSLALKYNHRAETIGTTTHGKGITQAVTKVRDRELHVTNSFFNPADVFTNGIGGKPDLEVEKSLSEIDNQLAAAVIRVTEIHQRDVDAGAAREKEISAGYQRNKTLWAPAPHQPQDKK
jgi:C-terminal processing protease CtpA/Prc